MKTFEINGKKIEFDDSKKYFDYFIEEGRGIISDINLENMLKLIESGEMPVDEDLKDFMTLLRRWKTDAPRKRGYREMRAKGFNVVSAENFFDEEGGDKIIDNLENTGVFADYFLTQAYGE